MDNPLHVEITVVHSPSDRRPTMIKRDDIRMVEPIPVLETPGTDPNVLQQQRSLRANGAQSIVTTGIMMVGVQQGVPFLQFAVKESYAELQALLGLTKKS